MKILLTGTSGQLGQSLVKALNDVCELITPNRHELDLSNVASIAPYIQQCKPDLIINPAAYTAVDLAEKERETAFRVNAQAPTVFAQEAKKLGIGLIHFSTDYVFDGSKATANGEQLPYNEQDSCKPLNVYGASKLAGEQAITESGCQHLILRTSWVYSDFGKNFLLTILRLAKEKTDLNIVNDQWGTPSSTLFLSDVTKQIWLQMQGANNAASWWQNHSGIYHLTPDGFTNWCEFSQEIVNSASHLGLLDMPRPNIHGIPSSAYPTPAQRPMNSRLDKTKIIRDFGITIPDWRTALQVCMQDLAGKKQSGSSI
ncbi:dTDP-4-dehydrorhamnose reductase [Undibacterium fentianense]|uniref:dTDP-4-dehydrorhamnose reductase n=1 Tax=Undibacterium fentianense TaxID=2828728 RepID=A0A941E142_9BURK|nr:dTDP-4-dehydrorhamnose reductase [Undibacterium fentianense]MBR7799031.1 dTDP-4-dehydrorhamnose reductase [Undibacterium fentianense]